METANAKMGDDDAVEREAGAYRGEQDFCYASRDVSCPPHAFVDDPFHVFLAPVFPSVRRAAFVPLPAVVHVPPSL